VQTKIKHQAPSPFPFPVPKTGALVTDERCKCGALRSEHRDSLAFGHGPLVSGDLVVCDKFTWVAWVFTSQLLKGMVALDDRHAVKVERGAAQGWHVVVFDMGKRGGGAKLFTTVAKVTAEGKPLRTAADAIAWAGVELQHHLERVAVGS
jgi:hypothetical protein